MKMKKIIAVMLSVSLLSGIITGCDPAQIEALNDQIEAFAEQLPEVSGPEEGSVNEEELARRFETEQPWINSNIIGTVRDSGYDPDLKDDFYVAVNREWMQTATLEPGYPVTSGAMDLDKTRTEQVMALMTDESLTGEDAEKCRNLYNLWLDWDARNAYDNIGEIKKHIEPVEAISTIDELSDYLVSEESFYYGGNLTAAYVGFDKKESEKYSVEIYATDLTLGDPAEYEEMTENGKNTQEAADATSRYMLGRVGYSEEEAEALLDKKYEFEYRIAPYEMSVAEWNSPAAVELTYNPVTVKELEELSPKFPLAGFLETAGYAGSNYLDLKEPEWLKGLNELYTEENLEGIKAYLIDAIVSGYIDVIDEEAYRTAQEISMKRRGISDVRPDEELAYKFVADVLSSSVARMFVQKYMTEETKAQITEIIDDSIGYYREMLSDVDWLSEETKEKAIEKLDNIGVNAAYPDQWVDQSALVILSGEEGETLLTAIDKISRFNHDLSCSYINTEVDPVYWPDENVVQVNSYYDPSRNSIYIIAGILGGDFYDADMSIEEKLGGIGTVIGHELSHAFDTNGAQFDKDGNLVDWWTEEDYETFEGRASRLIDYLSSMTVNESGKNYDGSWSRPSRSLIWQGSSVC